MKNKISLVIFLLTSLDAFAQGTFQNLNFEGTTLPYSSNTVGGVSAMEAFPGWTVYYGNMPQTLVAYNAVPFPPAIALWTKDFAAIPPVPASFGLFSPRFSVVDTDPTTASLSQIGTIPSGANSLSFNTLGGLISVDTLQVSFGGNIIPLQVLPTSEPSLFNWQGDLSAFAGQAGELRITALAPPGSVGAAFRLDNLQFTSIPEPSTWALFAVGSLALWCAARRRRK